MVKFNSYGLEDNGGILLLNKPRTHKTKNQPDSLVRYKTRLVRFPTNPTTQKLQFCQNPLTRIIFHLLLGENL